MKRKIAYVTEIGELLATLEDNPIEHLELLNLINVITFKDIEYLIGKKEYNINNDTIYITCKSKKRGKK